MSVKKQAAEQAIGTSIDFVRQMRAQERIDRTSDPVEVEDRQLASLYELDGWRILAKRVRDEIERVKSLRDVEDIYNMSEAEIGKRFLVASLVAEKLQWILDMVELPHQHFAQTDEQKETPGDTGN